MINNPGLQGCANNKGTVEYDGVQEHQVTYKEQKNEQEKKWDEKNCWMLMPEYLHGMVWLQAASPVYQ